MKRTYVIRYGLSRLYGRFVASEQSYQAGETVLICSRRGQELGEVILETSSTGGEPLETLPEIVRLASPADLETAEAASADRDRRFEACRAVFEDGDWPILPIDVEALLEPGRTVLHYLGPHKLDTGGLVALCRERLGLDLVLEPVGKDQPDEIPFPEDLDHDHDHGCGSDGSCGSCGSGSGGCGTGSQSGEHGGCSSCGIKDLIARRSSGPAPAPLP